MEITEVRVKLVNGKNDKLRAFCSITIDNDFVIRDLKVIDGVKGPFVAMPSRKLMEKCPSCNGKNHFRARFCNDCGGPVRRGGGGPRGRTEPELDDDGARSKLHTEIAHPINSRCREMIQKHVLERYHAEFESSTRPGYEPSPGVDSMDDYDDYFQTDAPEGEAASADSRHEGGGSARAAGARSESAASDRAASGGRAANGSIRQPALAKPAFDDPDVKSSANPSGGQPRGPGHPRGEEDARRDRDDAGTSSEDRGASPGGGDDPTDPHRDQGHERADARRRTREEIEAEPEDNFGAGIFP